MSSINCRWTVKFHCCEYGVRLFGILRPAADRGGVLERRAGIGDQQIRATPWLAEKFCWIVYGQNLRISCNSCTKVEL